MKRKFPKQVMLDPDEVERVNRVRIARWMGIPPALVDEMSAQDVEDILEIMWADEMK
jgi:hypothetical protein